MKLHQARLWFNRNFIVFVRIFLNFLTAIFIILTLIVVFSTIIELCSLDFDLTFKSYHNWLSILNDNIPILAITIALFSIFLIFKQLNIAIQANKNSSYEKWSKIKLSEFEEYRIITHIYDHFKSNLNKIYDFLYELDESFVFNRKKELENFFEKFINDKIEFFEITSEEFNRIKQYTEIKSYSINDVKKFTNKILKPSPHYTTFYTDFDSLYNKKIEKMIIEKDLKK